MEGSVSPVEECGFACVWNFRGWWRFWVAAVERDGREGALWECDYKMEKSQEEDDEVHFCGGLMRILVIVMG